MKRLLPALLLLIAPPSARAQVSAAPIGVTAKVQSAVTLSGAVALDFGSGIVPGTPTTVTPANGGRLMASYNVNTQLSIPNSVTLTRTGGGTIAVTLSCAEASISSSATPIPFATDCLTGFGATLVGNARTDWWLYLGGSIAGAATSTVPAGVYTGNATVTATFTTY
jgi:spore coat protein U-like protein